VILQSPMVPTSLARTSSMLLLRGVLRLWRLTI
jgi:hypothetical protein